MAALVDMTCGKCQGKEKRKRRRKTKNKQKA